jgi:exonuclease III
MRLTVATWNMNQKRAGWAYLDQLVHRLGVDVALVQEAKPPPSAHLPGFDSVPPADDPGLWRIGPTRPWSSAIIAYGYALSEVPTVRVGDPIPDDHFYMSHPGALRIATVGSEPPITVASLYGLMIEGRHPGDKDRFAISTVNRMLSDLTPLIYSTRGKRMVIGGDLNIDPQYPQPWGRHHQLILDRMEALGFVDCSESPARTILRETTRPYQDDRIFRRNVERVSCLVLNSDDDRLDLAALGVDHCPLVATFEI